jgi:hypothetical protein
LSVVLKSVKIELKDTGNRYDCDRKKLEKEIEALMNYKMKHETSVRELKKKQKKHTQKFKKETKKAAAFEVEKMKESRRILIMVMLMTLLQKRKSLTIIQKMILAWLLTLMKIQP